MSMDLKTLWAYGGNGIILVIIVIIMLLKSRLGFEITETMAIRNQAINTVAVSLGKQVIAEYVENSKILDILKADGISLA